ncbi:ABC-2 type transporter [Thermoanaerobacter kivui]|uniref:Transport permease protein n=1 Tax=Thermoanaerobacter kivui TaxID=2325 RepID=A0A097AP53_THEKI|nr:ABC transporter permease [Thermoanaerobacter kivui]AIS51586.1 ABC-2 type transporter [Thermoanaerobacter kivui]
MENSFKTTIRKMYGFFKVEVKALLRDPTTVFFMLALPMVLTVVFGSAFGKEPTHYGEHILGIDTVVPINIIFLLANAGLMGIPITISELKEQGVIKRYITYPVDYKIYFGSLMATFSIVSIISTLLFTTVSFIFYKATLFIHLLGIMGFAMLYFLNMYIYYGIGFLLSLLIKSARTANIVTSFLFLTLIFTSGIVLPLDSLPPNIEKFANLLPMSHSIQVTQMWWYGLFSFKEQGKDLIYLVIVAIILYFLLRRVKVKWD